MAISSGTSSELRRKGSRSILYTRHRLADKGPSGDPSGMPYTLFSVGDIGTAGLMELMPQMLEAGMKPAWVGFVGGR